jgi:uncharacterized cupin superfamily protein
VANRTPIFLNTGGSLAGVSSTADNVLAAGVQSGTATDLSLSRTGAAGTTVTVGASAVTLGLSLASLDVGASTFNLANTTATTLNIGGAATTVEIGAASGTTNVNNNLDVDGDVNIDGGDLNTSAATFNLVNTTATTVNFAQAGTSIGIGAATGTTTINNANTVIAGSLAANGAAITTDDTTFALLNTTATTVNFAGGATSAVNIGNAAGTTTIAGTGTVAGVLNANGGSIATDDTTFNLLNTTATTINFGGAATAINMGVTSGTTTITGNVVISQNLTVNGTTTTTHSEQVLIDDNHLYLNNAYNTVVAQTGGIVVNYLPTSTNDTVAAGGFATTSTIATTGAATFSPGDIIQVSGAANPSNDGIYEVLTHASNVLTIDTSPTEDFLQNVFVVSVGAVGTIRKVNVSVMRAGTDGLWEVAAGSTTPLTFADLATGTSSGWTDDGTVVRLTTASDNVGIGTATPGANKVNITNDTVGDRNLLLVEVASQTAAPFRIETSAAALEFQVAVGGDTTVAGDLAVNGGDLTTTSATATLFNTGATTSLAIGGASPAITMGTSGGTVTVAGDLAVNGTTSADITTTTTTASVFNTTATTLNIGGAATTANLVTAGTTVALGGSSGTLTIGNPTITGTNATTFNMNGASPSIVTSSTGTASVFNTNATTLNLGGAAATINAGAAASTFATGFNAVTSSQTTVALFNATTTTLNLGGAASINMGSSGGTTTVAGNLTVNGSVTLGDAGTDNVAVNGEFTTSLIPDVDVTYNLGSATKRWNNLFIGNLDSLSVGTTYVAETGVGVSANRVVYKIAASNEVAHANATALSSCNATVGVTRAAAASGADVTVDYAGVVTMDAATGITISSGDIVYLAAGTTGEVTNVAPTASASVVLVVGIAKTTSSSGGTFLAQFQPRTPYVNP